MKQFLFLMTHVGAETSNFCKVLTKNPVIELFRSSDEWMYNNYDSFNYLSVQNHKAANAAAIYMDEICYNFKFQRNMILQNCKFIYYIGEPRASIHKIVETYGENALKYYLFRLQGLYEYIIRTKGIVVTWKNWHLDEIEKYLNLRVPLIGEPEEELNVKGNASYELVIRAEKTYEDLLYKIETFHETSKITN